MTEWILDNVPAALLGAGGLGIVFLAWRFGGVRAALAVLAVLITGGAYRAGRQASGADARARQQKANEKAVKDYERIEAETGRMSDDDLDAANDPWVRKPSGKR